MSQHRVPFTPETALSSTASQSPKAVELRTRRWSAAKIIEWAVNEGYDLRCVCGGCGCCTAKQLARMINPEDTPEEWSC